MPDSLSEGSLVARYRIVERIGAGGMGEVYSAHDPQLDRRIAIKILPAHLVAKQDRVRRFVQEAKSASALSHPNIVVIHEIGEDAPLHYIAMELVDGDTFRAKIYNEKRSLRELLGWLAQAAEGLAKAHAAGIVHRDLKPDNIMVTRDGFAKVLDFGLAKLTEHSPDAKTDIATQVREETKEGTVLGTVGYMAPEQVEGKVVDARADIFSFGCILYEAIARQKPFTGDSDVDVMHKILHSDPASITSLAPETPGELRRIVRRCLAKDPDRRYQSMKDLAIELRDLVDDFDEVTSTSGSSPSMQALRAEPHSKWPLIVAAGVVVAAIAIVAAVLMTRRRAAPAASNMTMKPLTSNGKANAAAVSPDGRYLVYQLRDKGLRTIVLKQIATGSEVPILPASETRSTGGFAFSRDGNYLYMTLFERGDIYGHLVVVPTLGGTPRNILDNIDSGPTLSPDEKSVAFVRADSAHAQQHLMVASIDGSSPRIIATRAGKDFLMVATPSWSPDGKWIAAAEGTFREALRNNVLLVSLDGKNTKELLEPWWFFIGDMAWLPDSSALVISAQKIEASVSQLWLIEVAGEARRLTNDFNTYANLSVTADGQMVVAVQSDPRRRVWKLAGDKLMPMTDDGDKNGPQSFSLGPDGSLYYQGLTAGNVDIWRLTPDGQRLQLTTNQRADYSPAVSRDGAHVYFETERNGDAEVWAMDTNGANQRRVTPLGVDVTFEVSPDGRELVYGRDNAMWRLSTAGGAPQKIADYAIGRTSFSPDGKWLAMFFRKGAQAGKLQLGVMPAGGGEARVIAPVPDDAARSYVRWSADNQAVAYIRIIKGVGNLWLQPLDGSASRQITNFDSGDAVDFAWSADGKELLMTRNNSINDVVAVTDFR
jgi:serine/threonine protein kinase/Tol biopolymer transport system component